MLFVFEIKLSRDYRLARDEKLEEGKEARTLGIVLMPVKSVSSVHV